MTYRWITIKHDTFCACCARLIEAGGRGLFQVANNGRDKRVFCVLCWRIASQQKG